MALSPYIAGLRRHIGSDLLLLPSVMGGRWQLSRDDVHWDDDLEITYEREAHSG